MITKPRIFWRYATVTLVAGATAATGIGSSPANASVGEFAEQVFTSPAASTRLTVPDGACSAALDLRGAPKAGQRGSGRVVTDVALRTGDTMTVAVGSAGEGSLTGGDSVVTLQHGQTDLATQIVAGGGGANLAPAGATVNGTSNDPAGSVRLSFLRCAPAGLSTAPGAPTAVTGAVGDRSATIAFGAPGSDGGSRILRYEISTDNGQHWTALTGTSSADLTDLVVGHRYDVKIRAVNAAGDGPAGRAFSFDGVSVPSAPVALAVTGGQGQAAVRFVDGGDDGSDVTAYEISRDDGQHWVTFPVSQDRRGLAGTLTGLTDGTTYQVKVRARNALGPGAESGMVTVTPMAQVPGPPTALTGTDGNRSERLTFTPPADDGGAPITGYDASLDGTHWMSLTVTEDGGNRSAGIDGLVPGTAYSVQVRAVNSIGAGLPGTAFGFTGHSAPDAPVQLAATPGNARASLTYVDGDAEGTPITGHEISLDDGRTWAPYPGDALSTLENDRTYTIRLRAINRYGAGPAAAGVTVTPIPDLPGAPTGLAATPGDGSITLAYTAPADDGGGTITGYEYVIGGDDSVHTLASAGVIGPLTGGTQYTVRLRAANSRGAGPFSEPLTFVADSAPAGESLAVSGTTTDRPDAPARVTAVAGVAQLRVSWAASGDSGVTGYTASAHPGPATCESDGTSCVLGADAGTSYTVTVVAHSPAGDSAVSGASAPVTPALPQPPAEEPEANDPLSTSDGPLIAAQPGDRMTLAGDGYAPYSTVVAAVYSSPVTLGRATAGADGKVEIAVTLPAGLPYGPHAIVAEGVDSSGRTRVTTMPLRVLSTDYGWPQLPRTGGSALPAGLLLVLTGSGLMRVARKRRRITQS